MRLEQRVCARICAYAFVRVRQLARVCMCMHMRFHSIFGCICMCMQKNAKFVWYESFVFDVHTHAYAYVHVHAYVM
jgi:hypothetical protein